MRQRHLTVNVLARFERGDGDVFVKMRRRRDHDGLDLRFAKDFLMILRLKDLRIVFRNASEPRFVNVTKAGEVSGFTEVERIDDFSAPSPKADYRYRRF